MNDRLKGVLLVALGASIYGMLATVVKLAYQDGFTTAEVTSAQFGIGILVLLTINLIRSKHWKRPQGNDALKLGLAGTTYGMTSLFYYLSVQYIDVSIGIVLLMQSVWISIVVEAVMSRQFPNRRKIISTAIILFGTLLATNAIQADVKWDWRGIGFGFLAACSFASTMYASNRIANYLPTVQKSLLMLLGGGVLIYSFLIFTQIGPWHWPNLFSPTSMVEVRAYDFSIWWKFGLFLAIFGTVLPPILLNSGFPKAGLGLGSIVSSMELPVSVMMAFVLLKEQVLPIQWLGILLILSAIVYMNLNSIPGFQKLKK